MFLSVIIAAVAARGAIAQQAPPAPTAPVPATTAPAQPVPAGPPKPAGPALSFNSDAGIVVFTVRAEGATDFEAYFAKVKEALGKGVHPLHEQMAKSWTLYKVAEGPAAGQILYWAVISPVISGVDYDPVKILSSVFPDEALALHAKLKDALVSVNRVNLAIATKMAAACPLAGTLPCYALIPPAR